MNNEINEENILKFAKAYGYDMDNFNKYLEYQESRIEDRAPKFSLEEYALMLMQDENINFEDINMSNIAFRNQYATWMGFGDKSFIPDYLSFEKYCVYRDLFHLDPLRVGQDTKQKRKSFKK